MGPMYYMFKETLRSNVLAVGFTGVCESIISYGSQTKNAQMAYNQEMDLTGGVKVPLADPRVPWGPGICIQWLRNVVALSGIRVLSTVVAGILSGFNLHP